MTTWVYMFRGDLYCESCGRRLVEEMSSEVPEGDDRDDPERFPSSFVHYAHTDEPDHCASGEDCIEYETLPDGTRIGAWLQNYLTKEGEDYVRRLITHKKDDLAQYWANVYGIEPDFIPANLATDLAETANNGNRKDVIKELSELPPLQAAATAYYLRDFVDGDSYLIGVLGRLLERAASDDSL